MVNTRTVIISILTILLLQFVPVSASCYDYCSLSKKDCREL